MIYCTGWLLIPEIGDVADIALNYTLVVRKARQAEIPGWLLQRMLVNNTVSAGIGLIPLAGTSPFLPLIRQICRSDAKP